MDIKRLIAFFGKYSNYHKMPKYKIPYFSIMLECLKKNWQDFDIEQKKTLIINMYTKFQLI